MLKPRISESDLREVLAYYEGFEPSAIKKIEAINGGLINRSYRIRRRDEECFVLQRLNPLFSPQIHHNIVAVTNTLDQNGITTPRLCPTRDGDFWIEDNETGIWRMQTNIAGHCFHQLENHQQAHSAGFLVGRWHRALEKLSHNFVGLRSGVHDTDKHLSNLRSALKTHANHRLYHQVAPLSEDIFLATQNCEALPEDDLIVGHGDLKISNIIFDSSDPSHAQAQALIDLDTVAPMSLAHELGDAWRSWCNVHSEDALEANFDLDIFSQSLEGYKSGRQQELSSIQQQGLLLGVEWICLELSARFAADALCENYFGWDKNRFSGAGEHNLRRAHSQWALYEQIRSTRPHRAEILGIENDNPI